MLKRCLCAKWRSNGLFIPLDPLRPSFLSMPVSIIARKAITWQQCRFSVQSYLLLKVMIRSLFFLALVAVVTLSCSKDGKEGNTYIVSARKMIAITSNGWSASEPQLSDKKGYQYTKAADNLSTVIKAEVTLPSVDDSNRNVKGSILLNIAPDNRIFYAAFDTEPLVKTAAYAMLMNYNNETLQTVSGISSSIGGYVENGSGGNTTVTAVLSKVSNGLEADQLAVTYNSSQGNYTMVVFRQTDGRYIFSYRGNR
jgi:hypothetical protein